MALAKDSMPNDPTLVSVQATAYYGNSFGGSSFHASMDPSGELYGMNHEPQKIAFQEGEKAGVFAKNFTMSNSSVSSPSSSNSNGLGYKVKPHLSEEGHSVISFNSEYGNFMQTGGSLLIFEQCKGLEMSNQQDDYSVWEDNLHHNYQNQLSATAHSLLETPGDYSSPGSGGQFGWLNPEACTLSNGIQENARQEPASSKRPIITGENTQAHKKQCSVSSKNKPKVNSTPAKDPQSIAAKNRRERISERLKTLQDLVPNGSKVDLVTMLEKAISYVKFLQLQVKVLATDEFWPEQGGKAPELSHVKEAIDAILASQIDRNSSSK